MLYRKYQNKFEQCPCHWPPTAKHTSARCEFMPVP